MDGHENYKVLLRNCILWGAPLGNKSWSNLNFQTLLLTPAKVHIQGTFVAQSIWKAWEAIEG